MDNSELCDKVVSLQFGFGFNGFDTGNSFFQKHRISNRFFVNTLLENSYYSPVIIFAYSGYCQLCFRLEPVWKSVVDDIEPLGYTIGTVNAMTDGNLIEKLRISRLPSVVVVAEGRVIHYRGSMQPLVAKELRVFARNVIPNTFLLRIWSYDGLKRFIDQWRSTNKISVLIFGTKEDPRLRYLLLAMKYSIFARVAYVHLDERNNDVSRMLDVLGIKCFNCENILIFNDFPQNGPVAQLAVSNDAVSSTNEMRTLIEENKHLVLPRICSQAHLDGLCPVSMRSARKLCAVLVITSATSDVVHEDSMRSFLFSHQSSKSNGIQFAYIYKNKQKDFIEPFIDSAPDKGRSESNDAKDILVFWRLDYSRARFVWLSSAWNGRSENKQLRETNLEHLVENVSTGVIKLDYFASIRDLVNEYQPSFFTRFSRTLMRLVETAWFHVTKEEALPILSAVGTFLIILLVGYGLSYASTGERIQAEKRRVDKKDSKDQWHPDDPHVNKGNKSKTISRQQRIMREMESFIHELRAETYFGMIRLLKPGCRSIIVLVDADSKDVLVPQFACHVWPFRNNKTFSFGYLMVEKNLDWFRRLLEHTLPIDKLKNDKESSSMSPLLENINPRKTLGTVLVLCGWKLYFNIYHPMHTSSKRKNFLGFDDDGDVVTSEDSDSEKGTHEEAQALRKGYQLKVEDVLNGLPNWLDRLFEGSVRRYYIPEWPDNLK